MSKSSGFGPIRIDVKTTQQYEVALMQAILKMRPVERPEIVQDGEYPVATPRLTLPWLQIWDNQLLPAAEGNTIGMRGKPTVQLLLEPDLLDWYMGDAAELLMQLKTGDEINRSFVTVTLENLTLKQRISLPDELCRHTPTISKLISWSNSGQARYQIVFELLLSGTCETGNVREFLQTVADVMGYLHKGGAEPEKTRATRCLVCGAELFNTGVVYDACWYCSTLP